MGQFPNAITGRIRNSHAHGAIVIVAVVCDR
jgi:hypothetical protein